MQQRNNKCLPPHLLQPARLMSVGMRLAHVRPTTLPIFDKNTIIFIIAYLNALALAWVSLKI